MTKNPFGSGVIPSYPRTGGLVARAPKDTHRDFVPMAEASLPQTLTVFTENHSAPEQTFRIGAPVTVHSDSAKAYTPRQFIQRANKSVAGGVSSCSLNPEDYLALFQAALTIFIMDGLKNKFSFFLTSLPIKLNPTKGWYYELPSNYHTHSNLFVKKECCLWEKYRRFTFQPFESWSDTILYYTYTVSNHKLWISIPQEDCLKACQTCTVPDGSSLMFEYYYTPGLPTDLDEPLYWLPTNLAVFDYILQLLIERIYERDNRQYVSPTKNTARESVLEFATGENNKNSTKRASKRFVVFR